MKKVKYEEMLPYELEEALSQFPASGMKQSSRTGVPSHQLVTPVRLDLTFSASQRTMTPNPRATQIPHRRKDATKK